MPIVFIRRRADRVETQGTLDTILFEPEADRFSLVWRAHLPLHRDIFEISQVVIGRMSHAWWRSFEISNSHRSPAARSGNAPARADA